MRELSSARAAILTGVGRNMSRAVEGRGLPAPAAGRAGEEGGAPVDDAELARKAQEEEDARFAAQLLEEERRQEQLQVRL
jgi:hypothetical protein